jgi:CBS domain-containing protein
MLVRDVMTANPSCCEINETVESPTAIMSSRGLGFLPVLDVRTGREVVGVVTDRDVMVQALAKARDDEKTRVADCMTTHPVCCHDSDSVNYATQLMEENHVRRLPVVDNQSHLCGVVSISDLVRHSAIGAGRLYDLLNAICSHPRRSTMANRETTAA